MARYEREYGEDFDRWWHPGASPYGGMRSDGWGGIEQWQGFPGEEGWFGEGYEGFPNDFSPGGPRDLDWESRGSWRAGDYGGRYGGYGPGDFRRHASAYPRDAVYGGRGGDTAYGSRDFDYAEGWEAGPDGREWRGAAPPRARTRAAEVMTENPEVVTPDTSVVEVAKKMRDLDVGVIPVVESQDNRRLRGVITDRDIAIRAVAEGREGDVTVGECMTDRVRSVNKNDSIQDVMRTMRQERVRRVPVTDREGRVVGIIAQADLAVDYAGYDRDRETEVAETVERISEPARPRSLSSPSSD